jgi:hypothetical protein
MAFNFRKLEDERLTSLGTVEEIAGPGSTLSLIPANLAKPDAQVMVILTKANGLGDEFTCSKALSRALRSQEIPFGAILGCDIIETTNQYGKTYNTISFPVNRERQATLDHKIEKMKKAELPAPSIIDAKQVAQLLLY